MIRASSALPVLLLALLAQPVAAAPKQKGPSLERLVQGKPYAQDVARLFATLPADVFRRCPALVSGDASMTVIKPATFDAKGQPSGGAWKQGFPVSGCGNDTIINLYFTVQPGGHMVGMVGVPGDTRADPLLQRDAVRDLVGAVKAQNAACTAPHVRHTHYDGVAEPKGSWRETWIVSGCGKTYTVPLTFTPGAMGTQIAASGGSVTTP